MFSTDFSFVFVWYLTLSAVGLSVLPLTLNLFRRFADRGYIFSKILGILFTSYLIWVLSSLHILPFTWISIVLVLIFLSLISLFYFVRKNKSLGINLPVKWIILEELIFFLCLLFWSFVRANEPSIRGLEKYMDYGFVNSILRSNFFPPIDMWLTKSPDYTGGFFINYYYFGHYYTALLTKLSGLNSSVTYNLMLATLFAFTFSLSFSIGTNLLYLFLNLKHEGERLYRLATEKNTFKIIIAGLISAFLVSLAGNLHTVYTFTEGYPNETPKPFWQINYGFHPERYWYPNATRFIPNTIHEFPIYSFVVADLHGHVSDIPFVLLTIAVLLNLVIRVLTKIEKNRDKKSRSSFIKAFLDDYRENSTIPLSNILLLGLLIAVMYMTNAWDGLIYLILSGLVLLYLNFMSLKPHDTFIAAIYKTASSSLLLLFFFLLLNFPFMINFKPFVSGFGVLCAPVREDIKLGPLLFEKDHCQRSALWMLGVLWGFFYYNVFGFIVFIVAKNLKRLFQFYKEINPVDVFILILIFISTLLLIFPEFFYIKDIYPAHYRANTMFKLGYQAFMM